MLSRFLEFANDREVLDETIIEKENQAAHDADIAADYAMFALEYTKDPDFIALPD